MTTGAAQGIINTSSVAELPVPLPSRPAQKRIVEILNSFSLLNQRLTALPCFDSCLMNRLPRTRRRLPRGWPKTVTQTGPRFLLRCIYPGRCCALVPQRKFDRLRTPARPSNATKQLLTPNYVATELPILGPRNRNHQRRHNLRRRHFVAKNRLRDRSGCRDRMPTVPENAPRGGALYRLDRYDRPSQGFVIRTGMASENKRCGRPARRSVQICSDFLQRQRTSTTAPCSIVGGTRLELVTSTV